MDTASKQPEAGSISYDELRTERDEYLNGWRRALADYENLKKEQAELMRTHVAYHTDAMSSELLPIVDLYEQALAHVPKHFATERWYQGLEHIARRLAAFMKTHDIQEVDTTGSFNPGLHEAVEALEDPTKSDNEIVRVVEKGYTRNGSLIRPAKVVVNSNQTKH